MSQIKKLSSNQKKAITAILANRTIQDAAAEVNVNRKTLQRWMKDSAFLDALRVAEGALLDKTARSLIILSVEAAQALEAVLKDPTNEGAHQKRLAAKAVLENVIRIWEMRNFEGRLSSLERTLNDE